MATERSIAQLILTKLHKEDVVTYEALIKLTSKKGIIPSQLDRVLAGLFGTGWLVREEKFRNPVHWDPTRFQLAEGAGPDVARHYRLLRDQGPLLASIKAVLEHPASSGSRRATLQNVLRQQYDLLSRGEIGCLLSITEQKPVASMNRSYSKYEILVKAVIGITEVLQRGEIIPLRVLAIRIGGSSKHLDNLRDDLDALLGDLAEYGIVAHAREIRFWGNFRYAVEGYEADGRAGHPSVCFSTEGLGSFRILKSAVRKLLLVENKTAFEAILRGGLKNRQDCAVVYISGYMSSPEKTLVDSLVKMGAEELWLAADLDPHGLAIWRDADNWARSQLGLVITPSFMTKELYERAVARLPLDDEDGRLLDSLTDIPPTLKELRDVIQGKGYKVEQEAFLNVLSYEEVVGFDRRMI